MHWPAPEFCPIFQVQHTMTNPKDRTTPRLVNWAIKVLRQNAPYLLNTTQFIHVTLVLLHAVLRQMEMCGVFAQLLLILRHFLNHLRQVAHR